MSSTSLDFFFATVGELNEHLLKRDVSSVELVKAFSQRLDSLGPRYNALALSLGASAAKKAKDVDGDLKRGRLRGLVQGLPFGAKDLLSVAKQVTAWGAKPYADQVFDTTATALEKLAAAGALLIGKLAMVELAGGPSYRYASASLTGPGLNPWDTTRWSGGSSSGSAIAVAAGLVPFALGSETSGSILTPSAFCGVTGLRPTYGLVSRHGAMALSWTLDKIGPIAHSAADCGHVLHAMAGGDSADPGSAGKSFYYFPQYQRPLKELRIGFAPADFSDRAIAPARPAFAQALEVLRGLDLRFKEARLPEFPYGPVVSTIIGAEAASIFEPLISSGQVDQLADAKQIAAFKASAEIKAADYLRAMRVRRIVRDAIHEMFIDYDLLLAPARLGIAPPISQPLDGPPAGSPRDARPADPGLSALIAAGNLAGLPALSLPCGFADGLPVGIQLVGLPFSENLLIHVGKAFQEATDWHRRRPPGSV